MAAAANGGRVIGDVLDQASTPAATQAGYEAAIGAPAGLSAFRAAAVLVCVAAGLQPLVMLWSFGPQALPHLRDPLVVPLLIALWPDAGSRNGVIAFAAAVALCAIGPLVVAAAAARLAAPRPPSRAVVAALLAVQTLLGLLLAPEWLYVVAAETALLLAPRVAWRAWVLQAIAMAVAQWVRGQVLQPAGLACNLSGAPLPLTLPPREVVITLTDIATALMFQALAFGVGTLARREQRHRAALRSAHRELLATRELIGETAAAQERLRVARELHDSVGHQLTAMKLHLELATRQTEACEPLRQASGLAQALLAKVRAVVSAERVGAALRTEGSVQP
jgi:signal transduction histidine kinase